MVLWNGPNEVGRGGMRYERALESRLSRGEDSLATCTTQTVDRAPDVGCDGDALKVVEEANK